MKISDLFSLGFRNLWRRKLRTFLTVIGVVIGCASIVVMMSLGLAQRKQIDDMIENTQSLTLIQVMPTQYFDPRSGGRAPREGLITDQVVKQIKEMPHVTAVINPSKIDQSMGGVRINVDKYVYMDTLKGLAEADLEPAGVKIEKGRVYNPNSKDIEILVPTELRYSLYDEKSMGRDYKPVTIEDPTKSKYKITVGNIYEENNPLTAMQGGGGAKKKTYNLKVVGTYTAGMPWFGGASGIYAAPEKIKLLNDEMNQISLTPEKYKEYKKKNVRYYENISVHVDHMDNVKGVQQAIEELKLQAHNDGEMMNEWKNQGNVAQAILAGIGSISLIVAAIGITNTMVMSIYERTREIGVMKVIGASVKDIRNLFLLEAGMIGLFGGVAGVGLAYFLSNLLNTILGTRLQGGFMGGEEVVISYIPIWLAGASLVFSFLIGVITGYFPALRATRLSAIEAIRTE